MFALFALALTAAPPELTVQTAHMRAAVDAELSHDGRLLVTIGIDNDAKLWSLDSGRLLRTWLLAGDAVSITFASDDRQVAIGSHGLLEIFSIETGERVRAIKPPVLGRVTLSSDWSAFAVSRLDSKNGNSVTLYAMGDARVLREYNLAKQSPLRHAFSADGKALLLTTVEGTSVSDWSPGGNLLAFCSLARDRAGGVALSVAGVFACAAGAKKLRLEDTKTKAQRELVLPAKPSRFFFSPDGAQLGVIDAARGVHVVDITSGQTLRSVTIAEPMAAARAGAFVANGRALVVVTSASELLRIDLERPAAERSAPVLLASGSFEVNELTGFDRGGNKLLLAKQAAGFLALDLETAQLTNVAFNDAALGTAPGRTGIDERKLPKDALTEARAAAQSPDGGRLAVMGADGTLRVSERASGRTLASLELKGVAAQNVAFSPDGRWLAAAGPGLVVYETKGFSEVRRWRSKNEGYHSVAFSPTSQRLFVGGVGGLYAFDAPSFDERRDSARQNVILNPIVVSADGARVAGVDGFRGQLEVYDAKTLGSQGGARVHASKIAALAFSPDGALLATSGFDAEVKLFKLGPLTNVLRVFRAGREWLVTTPDGRFQGTAEAMKRLHYVSGVETISLDQLYERFYTPRLALTVLSERGTAAPAPAATGAATPSLARALKAPPRVTILQPAPGAIVDKEEIEVELAVSDQGDGVAEVRLFHNDKQVSDATRGVKLKSAGAGAPVRYTLSLVPGLNTFRAVAINEQRTESAPAVASVTLRGATPESRLFLLAVGVNAYKNSKYNLNYARGDAESFVATLKQRSRGIFKQQVQTTLFDGEATKEALLGALSRIAKEASANDVFVFYYAGHGTMSEGERGAPQEFYLAPHEVLRLYGDDAHLAERGVSAKELREAVAAIAARKQLLVLDACQSGGAVDSFAVRGAAEEKAMLQLAKSAGVVVLAATGTEQFASEVKTLGHGVFTFALLQGLGGAADGGGDGKITVKELEAYLNDAVPELTKKHRGSTQYPNSFARGQDFPLCTK